MVSFDGEARDRAKQVRFLAVPRQMLDRLADQQFGLLARPFLADERQEGRFAGIGVLARRLARGRLVAAVVDQIVGDLEGEADVARIAAIGGGKRRRPLQKVASARRVANDRERAVRVGCALEAIHVD
jgi:hypothetical protein